MYRTADNLEDLDVLTELNSFDSIGGVLKNGSFHGIDEEYHDVDFYIFMNNDSEESEIKNLLQSCGWTAWLEYDDSRMIKIG